MFQFPSLYSKIFNINSNGKKEKKNGGGGGWNGVNVQVKWDNFLKI